MVYWLDGSCDIELWLDCDYNYRLMLKRKALCKKIIIIHTYSTYSTTSPFPKRKSSSHLKLLYNFKEVPQALTQIRSIQHYCNHHLSPVMRDQGMDFLHYCQQGWWWWEQGQWKQQWQKWLWWKQQQQEQQRWVWLWPEWQWQEWQWQEWQW